MSVHPVTGGDRIEVIQPQFLCASLLSDRIKLQSRATSNQGEMKALSKVEGKGLIPKMARYVDVAPSYIMTKEEKECFFGT